ncbi:MAG: FAD:protein FMN transferase [Acidiferrobacterales bacterium]|nr:FAD:protein FMN transferase [Acidiferrobacterales bacterium]
MRNLATSSNCGATRHDNLGLGPTPTPPIELQRANGYWRGCFRAMGSPCEVLVESENALLANELVRLAACEAWRIERKYSRYRRDNIVHAINNSAGARVCVDKETARLLDFAQRCFGLSDGLFDITSGVLCRAWHFDGSDRVPSEAQVQGLLRYVGWDKVRWKRPHAMLPRGMEIDLGGIGKEYAVDRALLRLCERHRTSVLVNFGGDLRVSGPRKLCQPWIVGVEHSRGDEASPLIVEIYDGAVATSGDAHRFLVKDGQRYGHILDPRTGWPIEHAPRSVTIASNTCTEAGIFATLGLLHGAEAERFLEQQGGRYWCIR